ncbi:MULTISPECIES: class-II fumarase/aspartase family protein [Streptomyces]|uniref:class-II fumarase/aspartase family protein n=1 Tax=Streptomyces TaxID=1883 RepID=UPI001317F9B5|nr:MULTISPECIES: adenylosuccinate lyase family protein [Streptomyces]QGZ48996.1 3-carboxy-cis,cis-muconate cycloisomerase [Streptomyces sp. QHH-9511]GGT92312.1 3-carboxy-cis,cis-muconate cycloisomerase [Streptomyces lateritius]
MTRPWEDAGLLSPVRAGTPVEAVVGDRAWLQAMLDAEAALVRAQARLGTVPEGAARAVSNAARAERLDLRALALAARETANPVVGLVQALTRVVAAQDPAAAEYVHRGSTSQDIFDTGAMLVADRALRLIRADLDRTAVALAALAERHRDTLIAGRTLTLHAVPTTFGLKAAGWRTLLLDADERLARVQESLPVSLGGAAGTLAGYVEYARLAAGEAGPSAPGGPDDNPPDPGPPGADRSGVQGFDVAGYSERLLEAFAEETGLRGAPLLPWHALRTPVADLGFALAFATGALGKIAVDVQSLARTEVGEVAEPSGGAGRGASSAMPHKRNPVLATLIRSAALQVPALAGALGQCLVHEDERSGGVWHAEWQLLRECLRLTGGAAHTAVELAEGLEVRAERMRENLALTGSQVVSERIAAVLAPRLGKAAAKELLTWASVTADRDGRPLPDVLAEAPELAGVMDAAEVASLCDPAAYTGAAGPLVDRALKGTP